MKMLSGRWRNAPPMGTAGVDNRGPARHRAGVVRSGRIAAAAALVVVLPMAMPSTVARAAITPTVANAVKAASNPSAQGTEPASLVTLPPVPGGHPATGVYASSTKTDELSPVTIMVIAPLSGEGGDLIEIPTAVKAAAAQINARGGLKGHPIHVLTCDEQYSPNVATQCAEQAVQDHVIAAVGSYSNYSNDFYPAFEEAHIVNLGDDPITAPDFDNALSYPITPGFPVQDIAAGVLAAKEGCKGLALLTVQQAVALQIARLIKIGAETGNPSMNVTSPIIVGSPQADYEPLIDQAIADHADCLSLETVPQDATRIMSAIEESGHKFKVFTDSSSFTPQALQTIGSAANGVIFVTDPQAVANGSTVITSIAAAIKAQDKAAPFDGLALNAWGATEVLKLAARHMTSFTSESLLAALPKTGTINLGYYAPFTFRHSNSIKSLSHLFNTSSYGFIAHDGAYEPIGNPNPVIAISRALAKAYQ